MNQSPGDSLGSADPDVPACAPLNIVIADDHPIFRDGLRRLLEAEPNLKVVGEASDGAEAVKIARQLKPDILLLDLAMSKRPGLEALRDLRAGVSSTPVRVILLTPDVGNNQIVEALQVGARGVVLKDSPAQLLLKAIHTVMSGEYWVGRESVSNMMQYLRTLVQSSSGEARQKKFGLTPRELEVVSAVVAGYSTKEIAQCSVKTREGRKTSRVRHELEVNMRESERERLARWDAYERELERRSKKRKLG